MTNLGEYRVIDQVATNLIHGYAQAGPVAPFIAPAVPVNARSGKIIQFTKQQFLVLDTKRSPGADVKRVRPTYGKTGYSIEQRALGAEVTREAYEEAQNGAAQIDIRSKAINLTAELQMQSWEHDVLEMVTDANNFEPSCTTSLSGTDKFSSLSSKPENLVDDGKEAVRAQVGVYPNSGIIGPGVFNKLKRHPIFTDRVKFTGRDSVDLDMMANWFGLRRGLRVASRVMLDEVTGNLVDMIDDSMLLFYSPEQDPVTDEMGFLPGQFADNARAAFAYTYSLNGYPIAEAEYFDKSKKAFITDIVWEQEMQIVGLGNTGKAGAGFLFKNCI